MPKNISLFMDYCRVVPPSDEQISSWNDSFSLDSMTSGHGRGLEVTLEATHSAFFNDNMRFYIPSRMEDGVKSFINGKKPAKILKHHNSTADPVGIIVGAEYIPTIPEGLQTDKDVQILTDSSFPIKKQIAAAKRLMKSGIPFSDGWRGLGYIQLKAVILDEKTIRQVNSGLFDAVSTSFVSPGHAYCSICGTNLAQDGFCEHEIGEKYEDGENEEVICALVPGVHNYKECSLVVFDADPLTAIEIGTDSKEENKIYQIPVDYWKNSSVANDSKFVCEFKDFKEENIMGNNQLELSDAQKEVFDFVDKLRPDLDKKVKLEYTNKIADLKNEDGSYPDQAEAGLDLESYVLYAIENLETADQKINADEIYAEMENDLQEDAKLSTERRKNLPGSAFCGPDKSFPVPDCAHVTAARRLIGRYKGPGNKANILACVNKKAKAYGCDSQDSAEPQLDAVVEPEVKFELPTCEVLAKMSDSDAKELFNMLEAEVVSRQLKFSRPCGKCAAAEDALENTKTELTEIKKTVKDHEDTLRVLRSEMKFQMQDYFRQVDQQVLIDTKLKAAQLDNVALMSVLSGKFNNIENAKDSLKDADFEKEEAVLKDSFKLDEILDKLNDGMSNSNPEGTVEDPTVNKDKDNEQFLDNLAPPARASIRNIRKLYSSGQKRQAKELYDRMVAMKYFNNIDVPFDSIVSVDDSTE